MSKEKHPTNIELIGCRCRWCNATGKFVVLRETGPDTTMCKFCNGHGSVYRRPKVKHGKP